MSKAERLVLIINYIYNYIYDFRLFWRWSVISGKYGSKTNLEAIIKMDAHRLEKGLSLSSPKPNFGKTVATRLIDNINSFLNKYEIEENIKIAIDVLQSYEKHHEANGHFDVKFLRQLHSVCSRVSLVDGCKIGGVIAKSKDEIIQAAMIDFESFLNARHSIRQFSTDDVEMSVIYQAVKLASTSPSACNRQSARVHIFSGDEAKSVLSLQNGNGGFSDQINKVLVVTSDVRNYVSAGERNLAWIDGGMFAMSLVYSLHSLGLGTCCLNWSVESPADRELKRVSEIEEYEAVVMMLAVGHIKESFYVAHSRKKDFKEISCISHITDVPNLSLVGKSKLDVNVSYKLKKIIRRSISRLVKMFLIVVGRSFRLFSKITHFVSGRTSILLVPPESPGSLGDEAIELAYLQNVKDLGFTNIGMVSCHMNDDWSHLGYINSVINLNMFLRSSSYLHLIRSIIKISSYQYLYIIGTDIMDGGYSDRVAISRLRLANIANKVGVRTGIVNFSFNSNPSKIILENFKSLPAEVKLVCRDPISQQRLAKHLNRNIEISADIAFLLSTKRESEISADVKKWVDEQKSNEKTIIGLNINPQVFAKPLTDDLIDQLTSSYASLVTELCQNMNCSIVFLPHDFRGSPSDLSLASDVIQRLPAKIKGCIYLPTVPYCSGDVKVFCQLLDFIFSGRMHLAILGLSAGTPVACVTYQDKFEGLFDLFGIKNNTIESQETLDIGKLVKFITGQISLRESYTRKIQEETHSVQELARKNLPEVN